jgi:hypothetical protein
VTPITLPDIAEPASGPGEPAPVEAETKRARDEGPQPIAAPLDSDDPDEVEEAQEDPLEGFEFIEPAEVPARSGKPAEETPLMDLNAAVEQIPEVLRKEMADLLRAEFREVIRWKPGQK